MTAARGSYSGMPIMGTSTAVQKAAEAMRPATHLQHISTLNHEGMEVSLIGSVVIEKPTLLASDTESGDSDMISTQALIMTQLSFKPMLSEYDQ